jgi:ATP synthase F1 epsilon subunit
MLHLSIVTPERSFIDEECLSVTLPGLLGQMQILESHVGILAELSAGILIFEKNNKESVKFMIGEGVVVVEGNKVNVLTEQARTKSEIDKKQEEHLLGELKDQMKKQGETPDELKRLSIELNRCLARLRLFD